MVRVMPNACFCAYGTNDPRCCVRRAREAEIAKDREKFLKLLLKGVKG